MTSDEDLIRIARETLNPQRLSPSAEAGGVGCALLTHDGNIFTGVCIDTASGLGYCAERNAIGTMVTERDNSGIATIVAVDWDGTILPPCGTCREFIWQMHSSNRNARVILNGGRVMQLSALLPEHWQDGKS